MNRRKFLIKSAFLLTSSFFGLSSFSKSFAFYKKTNNSLSQPLISIIIDDIGYSISRARDFLRLNIPITFSVLPHLTNSYNLAVEIGYVRMQNEAASNLQNVYTKLGRYKKALKYAISAYEKRQQFTKDFGFNCPLSSKEVKLLIG